MVPGSAAAAEARVATHGDEVLRERVLAAGRALGSLGAGTLTAPRLLAALSGPGAEPARLAETIGAEPGLAARVLKVANSAFYGLSRSVSTVERAIVVLGLDAVRGIAAAACLDRTLPRSNPDGVDMQALLNHSVATAAAARALVLRRDASLAGDAFVAALLHDLGVPIQLRLNHAGVDAFVTALSARPPATAAAGLALEEDLVGIGHEAVAGIVFASWQLPDWLTDAVAHHHRPLAARPENRRMAALVYAADHLSTRCGLGYSSDLSAELPDPAVLALLGLSAADLDAVAAGLPESATGLQRALTG